MKSYTVHWAISGLKSEKLDSLVEASSPKRYVDMKTFFCVFIAWDPGG